MMRIIVLAYAEQSHVFWWIVAIVGGLFACYLGLIFFAALFEKQHVRLLTRVEGRTLPTGAEPVAEAERHGFRNLGSFSDGDKGFREGIMTFMLSADGVELLWIMHSKLARRHQILTRLADGTWLVTSSIKTTNDLSGLRREEVLPEAVLGAMLHYHRSRVAATEQAVLPFEANNVAEDWVAHARSRVEAMARSGLARYRSPGLAGGEPAANVTVWSYTLRGALKLVAHHLHDLSQTSRKLKQSKAVTDDAVEQWRRQGDAE
jgi:hypothetical protein